MIYVFDSKDQLKLNMSKAAKELGGAIEEIRGEGQLLGAEDRHEAMGCEPNTSYRTVNETGPWIAQICWQLVPRPTQCAKTPSAAAWLGFSGLIGFIARFRPRACTLGRRVTLLQSCYFLARTWSLAR
jgi:hypothetical protein